MTDKKLNIGSSFDSKGFSEMEAALKRVTKLAQEFVDTLKKAQFGKSDNKSSPDNFHNTVGSASQAIDKLNKALQDTDKTMIHGTQKSLVHTSRHMREYTSHVNEAASATGRLHAAMGSAMGAGASPNGSRFGAAAGFGASGGGVYGGGGGGGIPGVGAGMGGSPPGLPPHVPPSGGGGGGGFLNRIGYSGIGSLGGATNTMLNWGAAAVGALNMGASVYQGQAAIDRQGMFGGLEAQIRAQSGRDRLFSMLHGNAGGYGNILSQKGMAYNDGRLENPGDPLAPGAKNFGGTGGGLLDQVNGTGKDIAERQIEAKRLARHAEIGGGALGAVGSLAGGKLMKNVTGGLSTGAGIAGAGASFTGVADSIIQKKLDTMQVNSGEREALRGEMQAHAFGLLEQLGGPQLAAASGAQQGTAGVRLAASRMMGGGAAAGKLMGAGAKHGFDLGESTALGAGLSSQFGWNESRALAPEAMRMANKGFDASAAGSIMGRVAEGGGQSHDVFRKLFAEGVAQGMKQLDANFFTRIGAAVAEASVTAYGGNASLASGSALMGGLGAHPSMRDVEGNISGLKLANQIQESNPFFASRNLVDASGILGPDASGEEMEILGGASFQDLMSQSMMGKAKGEGGNELLNSFGVTAEQAEEAKKRRINRIGSVLSNGTSKPAQRLQSAIEKFGSFDQALSKGGKAVTGDAAALGFSRLGGSDLDSFKGMMRSFGGMSDSAMSDYVKREGNDGKNVADGGALGEKNKQTGQVLADVAHYGKLLAEAQKEALGKLKSSLEAMKDLRGTEGLGSVEATTTVFKNMGEAATNTTLVLEELANRVGKSWGIDVMKLQNKSRQIENKQETFQKNASPKFKATIVK